MKLRTISLALMLGTLLVGFRSASAQGPTPAPGSSGGSTSATCANPITVVTEGVPACNCSGDTGDVTVCHSESVELQIGSSVLSVSTKKSSSDCFKQSKEHGECLAWRYVYDCCESWWGGWQCDLRETQVVSSTSDCKV